MEKISHINEYKKSEEGKVLWKLYSEITETLYVLEQKPSLSLQKKEYEAMVYEIIQFHSKIENWLVKCGYAHFEK